MGAVMEELLTTLNGEIPASPRWNQRVCPGRQPFSIVGSYNGLHLHLREECEQLPHLFGCVALGSAALHMVPEHIAQASPRFRLEESAPRLPQIIHGLPCAELSERESFTAERRIFAIGVWHKVAHVPVYFGRSSAPTSGLGTVESEGSGAP